MKDQVMKLDYTKTFKRIAVLFVILAVITVIAIPLSLSRQISDAAALKQEYALAEKSGSSEGGENQDGGHNVEHADEHEREHEREREWKSRITPLSAMNYAVIGGLGVLWAALAACYWLAVIAWLYKAAVNEGMNKSLWPIMGLFFNIFAVMAFCIVRDRPEKTNKT